MLISVTNRNLCKGDFFNRIELIAKNKVDLIILREKNLSESEYEVYLSQCKSICDKYKVQLVAHSFISLAKKLNLDSIHLSFKDFMSNKSIIDSFKIVGVSVHSIEETIEATKNGASYILFGHIFKTNCKKDLPPRGLNQLKEICLNTTLPVFAIGGITQTNAKQVYKMGAKGVCVMSSLMLTDNPQNLIDTFKKQESV